MIKITLPDGTVKDFQKGSTPMDVAKNISEGFARNVISAKFNPSRKHSFSSRLPKNVRRNALSSWVSVDVSCTALSNDA